MYTVSIHEPEFLLAVINGGIKYEGFTYLKKRMMSFEGGILRFTKSKKIIRLSIRPEFDTSRKTIVSSLDNICEVVIGESTNGRYIFWVFGNSDVGPIMGIRVIDMITKRVSTPFGPGDWENFFLEKPPRNSLMNVYDLMSPHRELVTIGKWEKNALYTVGNVLWRMVEEEGLTAALSQFDGAFVEVSAGRTMRICKTVNFNYRERQKLRINNIVGIVPVGMTDTGEVFLYHLKEDCFFKFCKRCHHIMIINFKLSQFFFVLGLKRDSSVLDYVLLTRSSCDGCDTDPISVI